LDPADSRDWIGVTLRSGRRDELWPHPPLHVVRRKSNGRADPKLLQNSNYQTIDL
jgi:hypothetical protein